MPPSEPAPGPDTAQQRRDGRPGLVFPAHFSVVGQPSRDLRYRFQRRTGGHFGSPQCSSTTGCGAVASGFCRRVATDECPRACRCFLGAPSAAVAVPASVERVVRGSSVVPGVVGSGVSVGSRPSASPRCLRVGVAVSRRLDACSTSVRRCPSSWQR
ncbi:hypothetical protein HPB48_015295 [Haemaphysalis longicornis]|uniref:Uncharacterized protein n=1 Tax=Haemaphysalis longicornis TaxID=44386 RepID=A0A9J6FPH7_HAELO|nr:hypothetical protein HPB48_015295 [Haemaphysalis longicornis]